MAEKPRRRRIEREFGVPIAGEIVDSSLWTQTALKKWPEAGLLNWQDLFGREAPVVVDIGCGNGRFLLGSAVWRGQFDHLGVDILPVVIRYATRRANQRGLTNIRLGVCDGERLLRDYVPPGTVAEIHCYHPQPFYDPAQVHRRLITPTFLSQVAAALVPDGQFFLQTDNPGYWRYIREVVACFFDFQVQTGPWIDSPRGRTRREIIALKQGLSVFRGVGRPRPNLSQEEAHQLAANLPLPVFDADRRLRQLDDLERKQSG